MISIRPLVRDDEPVWRDLWTAYLDFYHATVPEEVYSTTFARLLGEERYDPAGLIAERDGEALGLVHYIRHRHGWKVEDVIYLQDLYATPEARGTGVGRALIEAVYQVADAIGCPSVYWLTQEGNATARRLYDRVATKTDFIKYAR